MEKLPLIILSSCGKKLLYNKSELLVLCTSIVLLLVLLYAASGRTKDYLIHLEDPIFSKTVN